MHCINMRIYSFVCLLMIPFFFRCANPVTPEGGPKDTRPPKVISCEPPNHSLHFSNNTVKIDFDEFVNLSNITSEITISPQIKIPPDFRLRGKSIVVKFEDPLVENTTYRINFGQSISDITENNILKNFDYVFSTGSYLDSLSIRGKAIDAFTLNPVKGTYVLLYRQDDDTIPIDSMPLRGKPYYVGKSDENGDFSLANLCDSPKKLIALMDQNSNLQYDQPSELVGFNDSLIKPVYFPPMIPDTLLHNDSLQPNRTDSLQRTDFNMPSYILRMFEEQDSVQRLMKTSVPREGLVTLVFRYPVKDLHLIPFSQDSLPPTLLIERNLRNDTVSLWLPGDIPDTLFSMVSVNGVILDTLRISLKMSTRKKKSDQEGSPKMRLITSIRGGTLNQFTTGLLIETSLPLSSWDLSRITIIRGKDSINPGGIITDSIHRHIRIPLKWQEEKGYTLLIPSGTLTGLHDVSHDTLKQDFRTLSAREFGTLVMNCAHVPDPTIVQLLNEKETVLSERPVGHNGIIRFEYLKPGKYKIKAIHDRNRNGRWDTGNIKMRIQPEMIYYFPKVIELRANWEVAESWELQ